MRSAAAQGFAAIMVCVFKLSIGLYPKRFRFPFCTYIVEKKYERKQSYILFFSVLYLKSGVRKHFFSFLQNRYVYYQFLIRLSDIVAVKEKNALLVDEAYKRC